MPKYSNVIEDYSPKNLLKIKVPKPQHNVCYAKKCIYRTEINKNIAFCFFHRCPYKKDT